MNIRSSLRAVVTCLVLPLHAAAQEPAKPATEKPSVAPAPPLTAPLKLNVIVSKYQGDKKTSSLPYSISLNSNSSQVRLRMGADVPYATGSVTADGKPAPAYAYRTVGLSIDATARPPETGGIYRVDISVSDSSIATNNQVQGAPMIGSVPIFRSFSVSNSVMLKDGQTTQLTSAADPVTGEILRVDVTLTVVK
jgi:Bacterial type II and III secretion system protein